MIAVGRCMKREVVSISQSATVLDAVRTVVERHVGTLPVVDDDGVLVGVSTIKDLMNIFLPDFVTLLHDISFVHDFGAIELQKLENQPEVAQMSITEVMGPPVCVEKEDRLLRTASLLHRRDMQDMPIVDCNRRLVGIASHVDLASAFFAQWIGKEPAG